MSIRIFIASLLFPLGAQAAVYNAAICVFDKDSPASWKSLGAGAIAPNLNQHQVAPAGMTMSDIGGLCELVSGADQNHLDVTMVAATATDIDGNPDTCVFTGTNLKSTKTIKTIGYGEFVTSDVEMAPGHWARDAIYLSDPKYATDSNWVQKACDEVAAKMPKADF